MALERAIIEIWDEDWRKVKAWATRSFSVQFNPTEYTRTKGAQIAEIGVYGIDSPILQFVRGQNEKLTLDLFFDTTADGLNEDATSVTTLTDPFYQLCKLQPELHAPPRIYFVWSTVLRFAAVVESIQQKFTLFNPQGLPLRATLSVTFREYKTLEEQLSATKLESADHTKRRVIMRGDTLSRIAAEEYGDPGLWRVIIDANPAIRSPRKLPVGHVLRIPPLDAYGRPVGEL